MMDSFMLPPKFNGDLQKFIGTATVTNLQWQTWRKPRGCAMAHIIAIDGGAGGGGGFTGVAASARGGGGSGGSSAVSRLTVPLFLLPDILYVQVGAGGQGVGSGGGTAGSGIRSFVAICPDNSTPVNLVMTGGALAPTGGGTGTGAAVGAAGVAGTIGGVTQSSFISLGHFTSIAGQAGVLGGAVAGANGTSVAIPSNGILIGAGAGGAGTTAADFAGGGYSAAANTYISEQRPVAPAAGSNNGSGGRLIWAPFFSFGGCGGSSSNAGVGGAGGNGGPGAGGGGGGGGTTGGRGGDGGPGLVIIYCW